MIFLTVGTQFHFDRLVKTMDEYAGKTGLHITAQIGSSDYKCKTIHAECFYKPDEMDSLFSQADVIVSHAGMGSIINAMRLKKPIIIYPRLSKFGEHRNDHQLDTLKSFDGVRGVYCARSDEDLLNILARYKELDKPLGLVSDKAADLADYIKTTYL